MRAWWSQLLLPHRLIHLRSRYDCSLLCFDEPTMKIESTPLCLRSSSILALTSLSASSQLMRWYLPLTSFIGYFRRYSPWPFSRTAAPLAQCEPRLIGESNTGSWRTQTPFSTTASIAQPTEQWPHTVRLTSTLALRSPPCFLTSPALALRTSTSCDTAMPAPTPRPERRRKERRSSVGIARDTPRDRLATRLDDDTSARSDLRVSSMAGPLASNRLCGHGCGLRQTLVVW